MKDVRARHGRLGTKTAPAGGDDKGDSLEAKKRLERTLDRLAASIRKFHVDCQRFFAGDLKLPPDDLREQIAGEIRQLTNSRSTGSAERFRLGSLEAQFNSFVELFGRRLRSREQSEAKRLTEAKARPDPVKGVVIGTKTAAGAVEALYQGLYLRQGTRNPAMDLERFRSYLSKQVETIRAKTGSENIQFRIAEEGGKMKIKAKPLS